MGTVRLMPESAATGRVKDLFEEIRNTLQLPFVPKLFRALAYRPEQLEAVWRQVKDLFGAGVLDVRTKSLAALAVAAVQNSRYFIQAYTLVLKRLGVTDEELAELLRVSGLVDSMDTLAGEFGLEPEL